MAIDRLPSQEPSRFSKLTSAASEVASAITERVPEGDARVAMLNAIAIAERNLMTRAADASTHIAQRLDDAEALFAFVASAAVLELGTLVADANLIDDLFERLHMAFADVPGDYWEAAKSAAARRAKHL